MRSISELEMSLVYGGDGGGSLDLTDQGANHDSPWVYGSADYPSAEDFQSIVNVIGELHPSNLGNFLTGVALIGGIIFSVATAPVVGGVAAIAALTVEGTGLVYLFKST